MRTFFIKSLHNNLLSILLILIVLCAFAANAHAADNLGFDAELEAELEALLSGDEEVPVHEYPKIEPEYSFAWGYRYVDLEGSKSVDKYSYLVNSPVLLGNMRVFAFPSRVYMDIDLKGQEDSFTELRYAYGDKVFFKWTGIKLHSNFEYMPLIDADTSTSTPGVSTAADCGNDCSTGVSINKAFIRFKASEYPAHIFLDYLSIDRDGTRQNRYLGGSGYFNNLVRTSESEKIDSSFVRHEVGINAHLGVVEAQYSFAGQYYDPKTGDEVSSITGNNAWAAGTYPIGSSPKLEGASQTLKVHSSYTGKIVMAASLSIKEFKNESSGAENDYVLGKASIVWMPITKFTLAVRYKHTNMQSDNPSSIIMTDTLNPLNSYAYDVRPSISYTREKLSVTGRFRPTSNITLKGNYSLDKIDRENASDWGLDSDVTTKHEASLESKVRFGRKLSVKASVEHEKTEDPAYNSELDFLNSAKLSTSWTPHHRVITNFSYTAHQGERRDLDYDTATNARDKETLDEHITASVTFLMSEDATLTLGYHLLNENMKQDLVYQDLSGSPFVSPGVLQEVNSTGYSIDLSYLVSEKFTFAAGASFNASDASFNTSNVDLLQPVSVASLNDFKYEETSFEASGKYELSSSSSVSLEYEFIKLEETLDNPNNGIEDGEVQSVTLIYRKNL